MGLSPVQIFVGSAYGVKLVGRHAQRHFRIRKFGHHSIAITHDPAAGFLTHDLSHFVMFETPRKIRRRRKRTPAREQIDFAFKVIRPTTSDFFGTSRENPIAIREEPIIANFTNSWRIRKTAIPTTLLLVNCYQHITLKNSNRRNHGLVQRNLRPIAFHEQGLHLLHCSNQNREVVATCQFRCPRLVCKPSRSVPNKPNPADLLLAFLKTLGFSALATRLTIVQFTYIPNSQTKAFITQTRFGKPSNPNIAIGFLTSKFRRFAFSSPKFSTPKPSSLR